MEQPTKEEVEKWKYESAHSPLHDHAFENHNRLICIADAYLALREEVQEKDKLLKTYEQLVYESNEQGLKELERMSQLQADNEALRAQIEALEWSIRNPPITSGGVCFPPQVSTGTNSEMMP